MQEAAGVDGSPGNGKGNGNGNLRSSTPDRPSTGFTAVNGVSKNPALFRPHDPPPTESKALAPEPTTRRASELTQDPAHVSRHCDGDMNDPRARTETVNGKRKRADHLALQSFNGGEAADAKTDGSSMNRPTSLDSAVDLTTAHHRKSHGPYSDESDLSDNEHRGAYQRETSPVERWNRGDPPPNPRPETEASLAASLQHFTQTQQSREASHNQGYSPRYPSPTDDREYLRESRVPSDDQHNGDALDNKRRKRNFSNRTKTGCHTCRRRKKKCDEGKPECDNCKRGQFPCDGYGPRPPGYRTAPQQRAPIPLQSKTPMAPYNGRQIDAPPARPEEGRSYSHWGRVTAPSPPPRSLPAPSGHNQARNHLPVAPADPRRHSLDNWPALPHPPPPPETYRTSRTSLPPQYPPIPSAQSLYPQDQRQYPPPSMQQWATQQLGPPAPHPPQHLLSSHHVSSHPPPMPLEPWAPQRNIGPYLPPHQLLPAALPPSTAPPVSSGGSATSNRSERFHLGFTDGEKTSFIEKDKMLRGQPFLHYTDTVLRRERHSCKVAVERYNRAAETASGVSDTERGQLFTQVINPGQRVGAKSQEEQRLPEPDGSIGDQTIVQPPFNCEYGYNIHIGSKCIIESGCFFQDAANISIGDEVSVGHNVKLYCRTTPWDPTARDKGIHSRSIAGAIRLQDGCQIGADAIIMPYVTVGSCAVVGAGSVVTKDVEEYTVVAGNPARFIRRLKVPHTGRHHSHQIQQQKEKMLDWMMRYANDGFCEYPSPRIRSTDTIDRPRITM